MQNRIIKKFRGGKAFIDFCSKENSSFGTLMYLSSDGFNKRGLPIPIIVQVEIDFADGLDVINQVPDTNIPQDAKVYTGLPEDMAICLK